MGENTVKHKLSKKTAILLILVLTLLVLGAIALGLYMLSSPERFLPAPTPEPTAEPTPEPTPEPGPVYHRGYFRCPDGLFHPEQPLSLDELAQALAAAGDRDVFFDGDGGELLTEERFSALLTEHFPAEEVASAMSAVAGRGDAAVTRAEAAVVLDALTGLSAGAESAPVFPDVGPDYWARDAIAAAGSTDHLWPEGRPLPPPGFFWSDGWLYCADEDGYLIKNQYLGTLYFGPDGRYTSGSPELDGYVAALIRDHTDDAMTRDERLYAVYTYIRDNFTYLIRHYYRIGDQGWQTEEALTMYSTGKGNCYCYSSAFWAAARGLGYDAKAVSGTYGAERAPHGWVEIILDGVRYTYDVEIEMVLRRGGNTSQSLFAMNDDSRVPHGYVEQTGSDNMMPRETNEGLLPR